MKTKRSVLRAAGIVAVLAGLVWIGQGSGYFPYPGASFMINQMPWVYYGLATAAGGLFAILLARRI